MKSRLFSLDPTGHTGGRYYLRQVHQILNKAFDIHLTPDLKRTFPTRRWRRVRHMWKIRSYISAISKDKGFYLWDDMSILYFTKAMRSRTVFIFHHHDPLQYDSAPFEGFFWQAMFKKLAECHTVICVAPYWAEQLKQYGVNAKIIYNAFDTSKFQPLNEIPKHTLKKYFELDAEKIQVYLGKPVHTKGAERVFERLKDDSRFECITTGNNVFNLNTRHFKLSDEDYLKLVRACDVGVFNSQLKEGWHRIAAESMLLHVPCIIKPSGGLKDLAQLTHQPEIDLARLDEQIIERVQASSADRQNTYQTLSQFDQDYFESEWLSVSDSLMEAGR